MLRTKKSGVKFDLSTVRTAETPPPPACFLRYILRTIFTGPLPTTIQQQDLLAYIQNAMYSL
jgi:hypothetical protein